MSDKTYECVSLFAGVGGIDLGFHSTGRFTTTFANEYNNDPATTFQLNFPETEMCVKDIHYLTGKEVPDCDVVFLSCPCQAFSVAGYREGYNDRKGRGKLFFEGARLLREKRPQVIFFENVKNLVTIQKGTIFRHIIEELEDIGYKVKYQVLNTKEYSQVPQNRERIYIVGFLDQKAYDSFEFPKKIERTSTVRDYIGFNEKVDDKYYYGPNTNKGNMWEFLCRDITDENCVYQWRRNYVRQNKSGVIPTLTAAMGEGGNNVPIVKTDYGIRKLTPRECFRAQGFPDNFKFPEKMCDSKLYKQAGNSVSVPVIQRIAENIATALDKIN